MERKTRSEEWETNVSHIESRRRESRGKLSKSFRLHRGSVIGGVMNESVFLVM